MTDKLQDSKRKLSPEWYVRGVLTKFGDTIDRHTGRRWEPSSNLATSELIGRLKALLDSESKEVEGKGIIVPHNIRLKIEWNKFSTDSDEVLTILERELLVAAADHINDSLYYTLAPLDLKVTPDYFIEGIKMFASFDNFFDANDHDRKELNITVPSLKMPDPPLIETGKPSSEQWVLLACVDPNKKRGDVPIEVPTDGRISIGRAVGNHFVIDDISISKIHASLSVGPEGEISVADTGSSNGTFINGQRIAYGKVSRLEASDIVTFGTVEVAFNVKEQVLESTMSVPEDDSAAKTVDIGEFTFRSTTVSDKSPATQPPAEEVPKIGESDPS